MCKKYEKPERNNCWRNYNFKSKKELLSSRRSQDILCDQSERQLFTLQFTTPIFQSRKRIVQREVFFLLLFACKIIVEAYKLIDNDTDSPIVIIAPNSLKVIKNV